VTKRTYLVEISMSAGTLVGLSEAASGGNVSGLESERRLGGYEER
jgi:hypothetical protein